MTSQGAQPNQELARDDSADWLYFGNPDDANQATEPVRADAASLDGGPRAAQPEPADLEQTQPIPGVPQHQPTPEQPPEAAPAKPRRPPMAPETRAALLREVVGRGARRVAAMLAITVAVTWLSGGSPEAVPIAVLGVTLAALTVLAEVGAWFLLGRRTDPPLLIPTRLPWCAGLFTLALFVAPQQGGTVVWLATFAAGYLAGLATQAGLYWLPAAKARPVLPSGPTTVGLVLLAAPLSPTLQVILGGQLFQLNAWAAYLVSWVFPKLPAPWPWHPSLTWLLAVAAATFATRGRQLAGAALPAKAPIFLAATALTLWAYLAQPYQALAFVLAWAVLAIFALGRR